MVAGARGRRSDAGYGRTGICTWPEFVRESYRCSQCLECCFHAQVVAFDGLNT